MQITKALGLPYASHAFFPRVCSEHPRSRSSARWAWVPFVLVALAFLTSGTVEFAQAQVTTGFRIYLPGNEPAPPSGKTYACVPDPAVDTEVATPSLSSLTATLPENAANGTISYENTAGEAATNPNFSTCESGTGSQVTWAFSANRQTEYKGFSINYGPDTGGGGNGGTLTYTGDGEDYEGVPSYTLNIIARYSGGPDGKTGQASVTVKVNITNVDEPPVFTNAHTEPDDDDPAKYEFKVEERYDASENAKTLGSIIVSDPDDAQALISWAITGTEAANYEIVDGRNFRYTGSGINHVETNASTTQVLTVTATSGAQSTNAEVTVKVIDYPKYDREDDDGNFEYEFDLREGITAGSVLGTVGASSLVEGVGGIEYTITASVCSDGPGNMCNYKDSLVVDLASGAISFDHAKAGEPKEPVPSRANASTRIPPITLTLTATETTGCGGTDEPVCETSSANVIVTHTGSGGTVRFPNTAPITIDLPANQPSRGALTGNVKTATGGTPPYTYILEGSKASLFNIGSSGSIFYTGSGESSGFNLTLKVTDSATPKASAVRTIKVNIGSTGENRAPTFAQSSYDFTLEQSTPGPIIVGVARAADPDGDDLTYTLVGISRNLFSVASDGQISYTGTGESGTPSLYTMKVEASDGTLSASATITVKIIANTSGVPQFSRESYTFSLPEDATKGTLVGEPKASVKRNLAIVYRLQNVEPAGKFVINSTSGAISYNGNGEDYESATNSFSFDVTASTSISSDTASVTVNVTDVNESPVFANESYSFSIKEDIASGGGGRYGNGNRSGCR